MDHTFYLLQLKFFKSFKLETIILYAMVAKPVCWLMEYFLIFLLKVLLIYLSPSTAY